jgi:hypothetical protein
MRALRLDFGFAIALALMIALASNGAFAQSKIGTAASAEHQVEAVIGGVSQPLAEGSAVFQDQLVRTGEAGKAQLRFLDQTDLSVGPQSEVKLDRFVYNPDRRTGTVVLQANLGLFRFVTGTLDSKSYTIKTPYASIGVRGTAFSLLIGLTKMSILLERGVLRLLRPNGQVHWLRASNTAMTIHADGRIQGPVNWAGTVTEFASLPSPPARAQQRAPILGPRQSTTDLPPDRRNRWFQGFDFRKQGTKATGTGRADPLPPNLGSPGRGTQTPSKR